MDPTRNGKRELSAQDSPPPSPPPPAKRCRRDDPPSPSREEGADEQQENHLQLQDVDQQTNRPGGEEDRDAMYKRLLGSCDGGVRTLNPREVEQVLLSAARAVASNNRLGNEIVARMNRMSRSISRSSGSSSDDEEGKDDDDVPVPHVQAEEYYPEYPGIHNQPVLEYSRHEYSDGVRQESEAFLPPNQRDNLVRSQGCQQEPAQRVSIFQRIKFPGQESSVQVPRQVEYYIEGMIFGCTNSTKWECDTRRLFGLPSRYMPQVELVRPGTVLFLFNYDNKMLSGVYEATSRGRMDIIPDAFRRYGYFPAQVEVLRSHGVPDMPLHVFRNIVRENFYSDRRFDHVLNAAQVERLLQAFQGQCRYRR